MELGEDLNHLNAPKKITLKIPKYPLLPILMTQEVIWIALLRYPTKLNNYNRVSPHLRLFSLFNVYKNLYILCK